tara:strand:- start:71 stop:310 length:240 start_codon:yes stop_codon:yes gene_type:complete
MDEITLLKYELIRCERNKLLKKTDIYVLSDYPHLSDEIRQSWVTYRQQLRDFPNTIDISTVIFDQNNMLSEISWPTPPS